MHVDPVVERFRRISGARIGNGPRHPRHPDPAPARQLAEFLETYPAVRADESYVEFLEKYCGASIQNEDVTQIVDIFGFTDASTNMFELDGPVVDDDGFLMFAQCVYHVIVDGKLRDTQEHDFALDVTGQRKPGVYGLFAARSAPDQSFEWHCPDFASWLDLLVDRNGMLPAPTS